MKAETRIGITALLNGDPTISRQLRAGIMELLESGGKEEVFFSPAEAAKRLRVHPKTLLRYGRQGRLTLIKLSRRKVLIRKEELDRFIRDSGRL